MTGRNLRGRLVGLVATLALAAGASQATAEQVQLKPSLLRLNANLELPPDHRVSDGVALILHGTLSHDRQDTIVALQENLKKLGVGSLAITLSLGVDDRHGPRDCNVLHDYALAGAQREVALWMAWLHAEGVRQVDLIGFSRGGAQIAALAPKLSQVGRVVLLAPAFATAADQSDAYQRAFGHPLAEPLDAARRLPLQKFDVDYLLCHKAPVLGATFLDGYLELPPALAAETQHPTLVVIAGNDEIAPNLASRLPTDVQRAVIEGSGHFFPDLYGEEAADVIAKFLKGQ
jgi:pimeloyl-ACP methyl ester carboxylesterase